MRGKIYGVSGPNFQDFCARKSVIPLFKAKKRPCLPLQTPKESPKEPLNHNRENLSPPPNLRKGSMHLSTSS